MRAITKLSKEFPGDPWKLKDLVWVEGAGWVKLWTRPAPWFWRKDDIDLTCEVCGDKIYGSGKRFCSWACYCTSFHLPERKTLVDLIAQTIQAGEYHVDPLEVADAMLDWSSGRTDPLRGRRWTQHRIRQLREGRMQ